MTYRINLWAYIFLFSLLTVQAFVLFWATMMIARRAVNPRRLLLGSVVMAAYDILVDLARAGLLSALAILDNPAIVLGVSLVLIVLVYQPPTLRGGIKIAGYFYALAFFSAGAGMAAQSLSGMAWAGPVVAILTILGVGEVGWGIVQQWLWQKTLLVPLEVVLGAVRVTTTALLDTGNSLRDPLSRDPVVIIEAQLFAEANDEAVRNLVQSACSGDLSQITAMVDAPALATRVRLIPYSSLGTKSGLLLGIRPDSLTVGHGEKKIEVTGAIIGLHGQPLSEDGSYSALIHPELVHEAIRLSED